MAARGASVTVLDYSAASISSSRRFFAGLGLCAEFVLDNALNIGRQLRGQYDIAMSFGLAEHFTGEDRKRVIAAHFDVLKSRGLAFISVPNRWNPPYRLYKCLAELKGSWPVEEYPFSRLELRAILRELGIEDYYFFGDSIAESASWLYSLTYKINPMVYWRRVAGTPPSFDASRAKQYKGTALDEYLSYALVVCGRPPARADTSETRAVPAAV
jgi:SAM-dependent methyltransferase